MIILKYFLRQFYSVSLAEKLIIASLILFSFILFPSVHASLSVANDSINLSTSEVTIKGFLEQFQKNIRLVLYVNDPENNSKEFDVKVFDKGEFSYKITINEDWKPGKYTVSGKYGELDLGSTTFIIEELYDPRKNMTTKTTKETTSPIQKDTKPALSSKIPDWVRNIALWFGQGTISEAEFIRAIQYLVDNGTIKLDGSIEKPIAEPKTQHQTTSFPDPNKDPWDYVKRYNTEQAYRDWFHKNFPGKTIYEVVGLPEPTTLTKVTPKESNPNILTNSDFEVVFSNPDNYKGKWAKLHGEITQILKEEEATAYVFDTSSGSSFDLSKRIWLITKNSKLKLQEARCYISEGKILGGNEAQLLFTGATRTIPTVELEKYQEISCLEAKYPTESSIVINQSQTQGTFKVTIEKIELTEYHTRVYLKVENIGDADEYFSTNSGRIIQDKKQYTTDFVFGVPYEDIEYEIPAGIIEEGIIIFKSLPNKNPLQLTFDAPSYWNGNDWIKPKFIFDISP